MDGIRNVNEVQFDENLRIHHSHGHSLQDIFALRHGSFQRIVDVIVYISSHQEAELLIEKANQYDVVLMPYGGGTNVTQALLPLKDEKRMIASVDMTRMNHVKWVDRKNMMACVEAGILGQDLERELKKYDVCCGHEPDSHEFSTLGGWISTRASGMKKNKYGNIDDIVLNIKIATSVGTFEKKQNAPRVSSGPDLNQFILGSEGTLGIITEAIIKVKNLPEMVVYDSIIFHNFESGTQFMYECAQEKQWPASCRLVDNQQFKFGMALKTEVKSKTQEIIDKAKKYFVTEILKFNPDKMCLCTIVYEGNQNEVQTQQKVVKQLYKKYKGFRAGAENGQRGYFLTYVIAYLRDFAFEYGFVAESFETSVQWKNVNSLCANVGNRIVQECKKQGIKREPFVSMRVTQLYDTGAAIYIYFGFIYLGLENPVQAYAAVEDAAREEIMKNGGCISHHHGVGKLRKQFMKNSIGELGINMIKSVKQQMDPKNIFANGNLY
ncbi:hypothetical protein IMG5_085430 [Ichthyophthirius multifiliis]|uniref:Alkylglycerone-phosphate synthase n=1 Tax=Ichthyophthirius multifiliis TaxID=5932 RepID=G0QQX8_ICHMU|nr:hypothetical protein IMG5_085430 [Ichthyophthirius multifiliis]EGR32374.1 hypothetical protein IMG5_085430 [Ichthyophthirius multifiliis]|eukprot:XP_004035860.1 hypothetical protein IMG5_085430 [Ichthyophthirius multifiliis]